MTASRMIDQHVKSTFRSFDRLIGFIICNKANEALDLPPDFSEPKSIVQLDLSETAQPNNVPAIEAINHGMAPAS